MPGVLQHEMNRRKFIQRTLFSIGAVFTVSESQIFGKTENPKQTSIALISDTHISGDINNLYRGFSPYQNLQTTIKSVTQSAPDSIVITGDLARLTGQVEDYQNLKRLLSPAAENSPIFMALGNHDDRKNFYQSFSSSPELIQAINNKHVLVVDQLPVRLIILDSMMYVNKVPGFLGSEQRAWLEQYLSNTDEIPTILFLHHSLGDGDDDLLDVERLFRIIGPVNKVKAVISGHSHRLNITEYKGVHLISLPATGYNFEGDQPVGWMSAEISAAGVELTLKAFAGNTTNDGKTVSLAWR